MKKIMVPVISAFFVLSCTNPKNKSMSSQNLTKQLKQDGISGYAPVNGIKMYYEIHGEGASLVLIHGGGSTIQTSFSKLLPLLAKDFKVIAVELQAHGHTSDRDSEESFK